MTFCMEVEPSVETEPLTSAGVCGSLVELLGLLELPQPVSSSAAAQAIARRIAMYFFMVLFPFFFSYSLFLSASLAYRPCVKNKTLLL